MEENLTLREIQLEELEILKNVAKYLDNKGINYFLAGGTLLGAVRHKGFIPWDDDVDIAMPRPYYEKLLEIINIKDINQNYDILEFNKNGQGRTFAKIVNKSIPITSKSTEDSFLWIDIFPIDGLPNDKEECKKIIDKLIFIKGQIYLRTTKCTEIFNERKKLSNKLIKILLKPFSYRHSLKYYYCKIDKIAKKYKYGNSEYVADLVWPDGYQSIFKKEWFEDLTELDFENEKFKCPKLWNEYLTGLYGNYMEIPSKDKQVDHHIKARKID